jgi:hypothetical protein
VNFGRNISHPDIRMSWERIESTAVVTSDLRGEGRRTWTTSLFSWFARHLRERTVLT